MEDNISIMLHWEKNKRKEFYSFIENMWEENPFYFINIFKNVNKNNFNLCFDVGHINVYGKVNMNNWFQELSLYMKHFHLSDNNGIYDEHFALSDGNIEWYKFFEYVKTYNINDARYVLELDDVEKILKSIKYLEDLV